MVCIKYWPTAAPGGLLTVSGLPKSLLWSVKVQASVKKPDPVKVNHCWIVTLPLDGRMLGGKERCPPANADPLKLGLFIRSTPPETSATLRRSPSGPPTQPGSAVVPPGATPVLKL